VIKGEAQWPASECFIQQCGHAFQRHIALCTAFAILNLTPGLSHLYLQERSMKVLTFIIPALALSSSLALAQTSPTTPTTPATPTTPSTSTPQEMFIPLFGSTSSSSSSSAAATTSTWFIDVANRQVVFCTQAAPSTGTAATTTTGQQAFTCTAQPIPAATATTGTTPGATSTTPAAGALPFGTS